MAFSVSDEILLVDGIDMQNSYPSWTTTKDGGWIVSWRKANGDVVTQRFAADGSSSQAPVVIGSDGDTQYAAPIEMSDGGWLQGVHTREIIGSAETIVMKYVRLDADGTIAGDPVSGGSALALADGGYAVFSFERIDDYNSSVSAQIFDGDGNQIAEQDLGTAGFASLKQFAFETGGWSMFVRDEGEFGSYVTFDAEGQRALTIERAENEQVEFAGDGSYRIISIETENDPKTTTRHVAFYDATGQFVSSFTQPAIGHRDAFISDESLILANGNEVLLWKDWDYNSDGHLMMQVTAADGTVIVTATEISLVGPTWATDIIPLENGGWLIEWSPDSWGGGKWQVFNADGSTNGPVVNALGKAIDRGGDQWEISYVGATDDGGDGLYIRRFEANNVNNEPFAYRSTMYATEDTPYEMSAYDFPGYDPDGDALTQVVITELPETGTLTLGGRLVVAGEVIDFDSLDENNKLIWTPPANANGDAVDALKFKVIDEHGTRSSTAATRLIDVRPVDDAPIGEDVTLSVKEDERFRIDPSIFGVTDMDGQPISAVRIVALQSNGTLYEDSFKVSEGAFVTQLDKFYFQADKNASGDGYAEITVRYYANDITPSEEHTISVDVTPVNDAPKGWDTGIYIDKDKKSHFIDNYFGTLDVDGDNLKSIIITDLPETGVLRLGQRSVKVGDEIASRDLLKLNYEASKDFRLKDGFDFLVRDDGGTRNGGDDISDKATTFKFYSVPIDLKTGSINDDSLKGKNGRDEVLYGGGGDDVIDGRGGHDALFGGSGRDVFVIRPGDGTDQIIDFQVGYDVIDMSRTKISNFAYFKGHHGSNDGAWLPTEKDTGFYSLYIYGVNFKDLTADDFIF